MGTQLSSQKEQNPNQGHTALIAEGGGLRGIFAAGVLDAFLEAEFDPFDMYLGVSAGANNLSSHIAGQYRRNYRVYSELGTQPEFVSLRKFMRGGHYMDLDWLWEESLARIPLDLDTALAQLERKSFFIVATNLSTAEPLYLQPDAATWADYLKASSAVPVAYRTVLRVNGDPVTDGGVSDPLPVKAAYERGARRILVLRTRPLTCVQSFRLEPLLLAYAFRRYGAMRQLVREQAKLYSDALAFIAQPPPGTDIVQIAPTRPLKTKRAAATQLDLDEDYALGHRLGHDALLTLKATWGPTATTVDTLV